MPFQARNKETGRLVAVKKIKQQFFSWDEALQLRELKSLKQLKKHPNIVTLKELIREHNELFFVFEYMHSDVYRLIRQHAESGTRMPESKIVDVMRQLLLGLEYCHKHGYFHRDIKPDNLLISGDAVAIADFGQAREIRSRPPYTDYVSTRWYRCVPQYIRVFLQYEYRSRTQVVCLLEITPSHELRALALFVLQSS